jgi:drug/metabolite transporter (DMT)-like permease
MPEGCISAGPFAIDPAHLVGHSARPFDTGTALQPQMTASAATLAYDRRTVLAFTALVLGAVAMGASPLFVRLADVGPYASAFWRCALALPFLAVWAAYEKGGLPAALRGTDRAVVLSGVFFAGDLFFWHLSILATTVANATFLATTAPICVALGAWLILKEKIGARIVAGLMLCLLGGAALVGQSWGFAPHRLIGDLYGLITAIFFGSYILAIRSGRATLGAGQLGFISTAITTVILFVIAFLLEPRLMPQSFNGALVLLALALVSQVGGQGLLAIALGILPATFSSLVIFLEAVAAAALAWMVLDETLGWLQMLGGVLILAGIYVARPRPETKDAPAGVTL